MNPMLWLYLRLLRHRFANWATLAALALWALWWSPSELNRIVRVMISAYFAAGLGAVLAEGFETPQAPTHRLRRWASLQVSFLALLVLLHSLPLGLALTRQSTDPLKDALLFPHLSLAFYFFRQCLQHRFGAALIGLSWILSVVLARVLTGDSLLTATFSPLVFVALALMISGWIYTRSDFGVRVTFQSLRSLSFLRRSPRPAPTRAPKNKASAWIWRARRLTAGPALLVVLLSAGALALGTLLLRNSDNPAGFSEQLRHWVGLPLGLLLAALAAYCGNVLVYSGCDKPDSLTRALPDWQGWSRGLHQILLLLFTLAVLQSVVLAYTESTFDRTLRNTSIFILTAEHLAGTLCFSLTALLLGMAGSTESNGGTLKFLLAIPLISASFLTWILPLLVREPGRYAETYLLEPLYVGWLAALAGLLALFARVSRTAYLRDVNRGQPLGADRLRGFGPRPNEVCGERSSL